jgi:hypothetical protein
LSRPEPGNWREVIACLYCDYRDREKQNPANMIGSLVKQLVMVMPKIPHEVHREFLRSRRLDKRLEPGNASKMLLLILQSFDQAYICVDALDECEREHRRCFLEHLSLLLQNQNSTRICVFLTGRPQVEIDVNECLDIELPVTVQVEANRDDIMKYLLYRINKDHDRKAMNENLRDDIVNTIANGSGGMYVFQND